MFVNKSNNAFDMSKPVERDTSLRDFQYYSYDACTPNQPGRIELQVQDTSRYFLPSDAFIEVEGLLTKDGNTAYTAVQHAGFVNNSIMALFKSTIYMIDGKEIETIHDKNNWQDTQMITPDQLDPQ